MGSRKSMGERYLSARRASNLRIAAEGGGAADVLMLAGWVAGSSERKTLALAVYSVLASSEMRGARELANQMAGWIVRRSYRAAGEQVIPRIKAFDLVLTVLKWHQNPACPACDGLGHPRMPNSPVLDTTRNCTECRGTGKIPMHRIVSTEHVDHALWLADELQGLTAMVFSEMSRRMKMEYEHV